MTREEAIAKINMLRNEYNDRYIDYCGVNEAVNMAIEALNAEPVRRGRWIQPRRVFDNIYYHCSVCGNHYAIYGDFNYCPNCGANMEEQE